MMQWSEAWCINPYIDAQHGLLVALINKLDAYIDGHRCRDDLVNLLHEIKKYAEYHFVSEENYMREIRYPAREAHARLHSEMLSELSLRIARVNTHWREARSVVEYLGQWLTHHVGREDTKLAQYTRGAYLSEVMPPA